MIKSNPMQASPKKEETLQIAKRPSKSAASSLGTSKKLLANYFSFKFNTASGDD